MEIIINTLNKFKQYKEKRIREFIQEYSRFCGIPWGWIIGICILLIILLLIWIFLSDFNSVPLIIGGFFIIFLIVIIIIAIYKYVYSLKVQEVIFECLEYIMYYERAQNYQIELNNIKSQQERNKKNIARFNYKIQELELTHECISKIKKITLEEFNKEGNSYSASEEKQSDTKDKQNELKVKIPEKRINILKKYISELLIYDQLKKQYETEKSLLENENNQIEEEKEEIIKILSNNIKLLEKGTKDSPKAEKNNSTYSKDNNEHIFLYKKLIINKIDSIMLSCKKKEREIKILIQELIEKISQIKIQ